MLDCIKVASLAGGPSSPEDPSARTTPASNRSCARRARIAKETEMPVIRLAATASRSALSFRFQQPAMFDTVCTYPLSADLFAQAIHPKESIVSVGLSTGHVQTFRLPSSGGGGGDDDDDDDGASKASSANGTGHIDTMWRTRRHKGSCRCLAFGIDGEMLYSAGTDGIVKAAKTETGVVENKIAIPPAKDGYVMTFPP